MKLKELLIIKLKQDLKKELNDKFKNDDFDKNIIDVYINKYIKDISFRDDNKIKNEKEQCCARIWKNHMGLRCSNAIKKGDYCLKHYNQIQKKGYLSFKRYDEDRPNYNEKGNKLYWYDYSEYEMIEIIIKYQNYSLLELTK